MSNVYRYTALVLILSALGLVFLTLPIWRQAAAISLGLTYFLWGLIVHYLDKDLHPLVAAEYLVISLLAVIILLSFVL